MQQNSHIMLEVVLQILLDRCIASSMFTPSQQAVVAGRQLVRAEGELQQAELHSRSLAVLLSNALSLQPCV